MNPVQWASIAISVLVVMGGVIVAASPESLGLSPLVANWIGVLLVGLGPVQAALQSDRVVRKLGLQPKP